MSSITRPGILSFAAIRALRPRLASRAAHGPNGRSCTAVTGVVVDSCDTRRGRTEDREQHARSAANRRSSPRARSPGAWMRGDTRLPSSGLADRRIHRMASVVAMLWPLPVLPRVVVPEMSLHALYRALRRARRICSLRDIIPAISSRSSTSWDCRLASDARARRVSSQASVERGTWLSRHAQQQRPRTARKSVAQLLCRVEAGYSESLASP
jgi:hypothetical protein